MATLIRDGVKLAYEESGSGPPIVFVHGWCGDRSRFEPQAEHFSATYRCVSLDLRGHGESSAPQQEYSIAGFADDVAWMCSQLGIRRPLVVGHSMGGAVALSLSVRHPELPSAIVMLDAPLVRTAAALTERWKQLSAEMHSEAYVDTLTSTMFMATDTVQKQQIIDEQKSFPRHVAISAWDALSAYDSEGDAAKCQIPALYVGADRPVADMRRLRKLMPHVVLAQTAGAGHFHQLEVPDQINAMIERFVVISGL